MSTRQRTVANDGNWPIVANSYAIGENVARMAAHDPEATYALADWVAALHVTAVAEFPWLYAPSSAQHTQRQALGYHGQRTVHHEAARIVPRAVTQAFGGGQMRQVKFRRVLNRRHNRYLAHAIQCLRNVRREGPVRIDLRVAEKPVRGLKLGRLE